MIELELTQARGVHPGNDERPSGSPSLDSNALYAAAVSASQPAAVPANAIRAVAIDGVVRLPVGTQLDSIRVSGADLVVTLPDGQILIIVDGALRPPQIAIGPINIAAANIAALIAGQEPEPAAGIPQSSGGNFAETPGDIGDPFGLGNLLPPTEFAFAQAEEEELIPAFADNKPEILIITVDQPSGNTAATATVSEAALPARGAEPEGSDPSSTAETVTGTIQINSVDQPNTVAVNGTPITAVGQTVATPLGVITITSIAADVIGYSYTLLDNSTNAAATEVVTITVTDGDGDVATATLTLAITDDAPTARNDADGVAPNLYTAQTGNVITGVGTTSGPAGKDTLGADGATVTGIRSATGVAFSATGTAITGQYGRLLMNPDGSYSYSRSAGTPGGMADIFTYQLTDGDGDTSTATLTINIGDSPVGLVVPAPGDDGTVVDEAGLSERVGGSPGSRDGDGSNVTVGAINFEVHDGPAIITINGVVVTAVGQEIELATGTFIVIAINPNSLEYVFLLTDNVAGGVTSQPVNVTIKDQDGDTASASFVIDILDDAPKAVPDTDRLAAGSYGPATGNVITDAENDGGQDTPGADGATVFSVVGAGGSVQAGMPVAGLYGLLTLNADGSYSYVRNAGTSGGVSDVFTYTLKDGDGDTSSATLTIAIGDSAAKVGIPSGAGVMGQDVSEAGLPNGSDTAGGGAKTSGSFTVSLADGPGQVSVNGVILNAVGQTIAGTFGILTITSISPTVIGYSYTLTKVSNGDANVDAFNVTVIDQDGDAGAGILRINIADDVPTATDDLDFVQAGSEYGAAGNVLTGVGGTDPNTTDGNPDVQGADGATVTGIMFGANSGVVGGTTAGIYGTLALAADGSYLYTLNNSSIAVLSLNGSESLTETFNYTITDADGDESTATLTVTINGKNDLVTISGLNLQGAEVTVSEANLPSGALPDSNALTKTGSFTFDAPDGISGITIGGAALFNGNIVPGLTVTTTNGILTITNFAPVFDPAGQIIGGTISYSYKLSGNTLLHTGPNGGAIAESFAISFVDTDGTTATSSLDVVIVDDVPTARPAAAITVAEDAPTIVGNLLANDTAGADGAKVTSVNVGGVNVAVLATGTTSYTNALGTYTFNAAGAWTFDPVSTSSAVPLTADFTYTITDGDGDQSTALQQISVIDGANPKAGPPISLSLDDQRLETGSTPSIIQPVSSSGQIQFTPGSDPITQILFGDISGLDGGLTWTRESDTEIVGWDNDVPVVTLTLSVAGTTATVTATLESNYSHHPDVTADDLASLGSVGVVAIDTDGSQGIGTVNISVSDDVPTITSTAPAAGLLTVDETNLAINATANFASLFNIVMGADQPGTVTYAFEVTTASGLIDVATGSKIILQSLGNVVEGRLATVPSIVAFRLTIAADGHATLDQLRAVQHTDQSNPDDTASLSATVIRLVATVTDGDGDQASAIAYVGGALVFKDDGPSIDASVVDANTILLVTQDGDTRGAAFDVATADLSTAFAVATLSYGADGPSGAGLVTWTYTLALGSAAAATGLFSNGVPITLGLVSGVVVGSAGGVPIFSLAVNATTGIVTLTQFAEIDHPLPGATGSYATQILELSANLIELRGTATVIDRDGDSSSDTITLDLGGNVRFADDGPSVSAGGEAPVLVVDETNFYVNAVADLSGLFAPALDFGADGPGSTAYELGVSAGPSGLIDSLTGEAIILSLVGGVVYGRTSTHEAFRIAVDAGGTVTFDQSRAIIHTPDTGPDQIKYLLGTNLITLTAVVTDGDGDVARSTADITGQFAIRDDAPLAVNDQDNVARDGQTFADGNVLTGLGGTDENGTDGMADVGGADGGLHVSGVAFGAISGTLGSALAGEYGFLTLAADGSYRYNLDPADPAIIALNANQTLTDVFSYMVADADGDMSSATITISITGANDFPIARADTNWVLDGASGSDPSAVGNVLQNIAHLGAPSGSFADVADNDPDLEPITVTSAGTYNGLYGTLIIGVNGAYTYTLNEDSAAVNALDTGGTLSEIFAYTISDGLLSVASTLTVTVFGTNDAPTIGTSTARISEEGLASGIPDATPNAILDTTNSATFTGVLAIADVDNGETLTVTLGDPGAVLTAGGVPVTWMGIGTGTLVGSVGSSEVIRVTLASSGAYTVTLSRGIDHPNVMLEDLKEFNVPVSVSDGTVTTTNAGAIHIVIEDDAPVALGETGSSTQIEQDVNTLFILDFSDSIDDSELDVMLSAVKSALSQLDSSAAGALAIKFVIFSSGSFASPAFTNAASANLYLDSLNPATGGHRPDDIGANTNYTAAIQTALASFTAVSGASNQVFFVSDGNPNQQVQFSGFPPSVTNSLLPATATAWNNFVDGNHVNVTAIGIDNNLQPLSIQRLRDVDLNDAPNNNPILIADFDALVATLLSVVVPSAIAGDLDANDAYGADGGRILSITVGATTYTWDGASSIAVSGGGTIAGSSLNAIVTPMGGALTVNFATGQYNYQPPTPITVTATEVFSYTLVDKDGDTATAALSVTITAAIPPVALDLDGDGVEFVSSAAGVHFDYNGDGVAESTAWVGPDDGLLVLDKNGDGKITDGSELVFGYGGMSDLQGLAANYDSNHDGKLDGADAAFSKFGIWHDANSNGITDPGELQSLAQAGITSISLVSDGRSYVTADGQVMVRGESTFMRADGSTGRLADASFATNFANDQQRALAAANNGLSGALLAAGLVTALPLAARTPEVTLSENPLLSADQTDIAKQMVRPISVEREDGPGFLLNQSATHPDSRTADMPSEPKYFAGDEHLTTTEVEKVEAAPGVSALLQAVDVDPVHHAQHGGSFATANDQTLIMPTSQPEGGDANADQIKDIISGAIEGPTVDMDALLGGEVAAERVLPLIQLHGGPAEGFLAEAGMHSLGNLFMPDMADQHLMAQMDHVAATGHV